MSTTVDVATGVATGNSGSVLWEQHSRHGETSVASCSLFKRTDIARFGGGGGNPDDLLSTVSKLDLATGSKIVLSLVPRMCGLVALPTGGAIE